VAVLNHTIVEAHDRDATAHYYAEVLGLQPPVELGPFAVLAVSDDTTLDVIRSDGEIHPQHYAFLVTESEFDEIFARLQDGGQQFWADPSRTQDGEINHWDDGRGVYFDDPNGHLLEIITRPYGSGGTEAAHPNPLIAPPIEPPDAPDTNANTVI
jgi:catechol 2,3-dioxygenase-like lactoylglutathione lyase family enzyme